jgi:hypothetical protein
MKNIVIIIAMALLLQSCSISQQATKVVSWVEKHCPQTEIKNPLTGEVNIHFECDSLWRTQRIKEKCDRANLCIDISNGKISGNVRCADVLPNPFPELKPLK